MLGKDAASGLPPCSAVEVGRAAVVDAQGEVGAASEANSHDRRLGTRRWLKSGGRALGAVVSRSYKNNSERDCEGSPLARASGGLLVRMLTLRRVAVHLECKDADRLAPNGRGVGAKKGQPAPGLGPSHCGAAAESTTSTACWMSATLADPPMELIQS